MKAQAGARLFQKRVSLEMKRMKIILTMSITMTMTSMKTMSTIMTMMNMKNMDITMIIMTTITMSIATKGKARMNMVSAPSFIIEEHHLTERNSAPMFLHGQRT